MATMAGADPFWSQDPRAASGSPVWIQVPGAQKLWPSFTDFLGHKQEVDGKWSSRDINQCPYGMLVPVGRGLVNEVIASAPRNPTYYLRVWPEITSRQVGNAGNNSINALI